MEESPKSPREEALLIANETRKSIIEKGEPEDVVHIIRACFTVADILNRTEDKKWLVNELEGYSEETVPNYRTVNCDYEEDEEYQGTKDFKIVSEIHLLDIYLKKNKELRLMISKEPDIIAILYPTRIERMISSLINRCLFFLSSILQELKYGSMIASIIDEIRNEVDKKLTEINKEIVEELNSIYINLSSGTTPAEWSQVSNSCRRVLKLVADVIFPPQEEKYKGKDGKSYDVKENDYINRICAFVDNVSTGDERKLIIAETNYLGSYLDQLDALASKGVHAKITKFHASRILTHTYLVISDIIRILEINKPPQVKDMTNH